MPENKTEEHNKNQDSTSQMDDEPGSVIDEWQSGQDSFASKAQREGPWNKVLINREIKEQKAGKQMKVTIERQSSKDGINTHGNRRRVQYSQGTTLLIGAKPERSTILYLKNIYTEEREDELLCKDIKSYGRQVGIRIMTTDIVHNRYCEDIVGCRIRVPMTQVDKALSIETWPDDITCRKWETKNNRDVPRFQQKEKW
jgi:hypothetical protein